MAPPHAQTWGGASSSEAERIHPPIRPPSSWTEPQFLDGAAVPVNCLTLRAWFANSSSVNRGQKLRKERTFSAARRRKSAGSTRAPARVRATDSDGSTCSRRSAGRRRSSKAYYAVAVPFAKSGLSRLLDAGNQPRLDLWLARDRRVRSLANKAAKQSRRLFSRRRGLVVSFRRCGFPPVCALSLRLRLNPSTPQPGAQSGYGSGIAPAVPASSNASTAGAEPCEAIVSRTR